MKRLRTLLAAAALGSAAVLAAPLAATPASAATPGSECTLFAGIPEGGSLDFPGTVSADGENCVPNTPITGPLAVLNVGLECDFFLNVALMLVRSDCPN
jgi:hypothetical protein